MPGVVHIVDDDASFRTVIERRLKKRATKLRVPVGSALARPSAGRAWPRPSHHEATRDTKSKLDIVRAHIAALTPREREVFALVICGKTNKHVAHELGATERTIKAHRHRVMEKMQVQSLAELVSLAERVSIWMAPPPAWSRKATGSDCLPVAETSLSQRTIVKPMREAYRV